MCFVLVRVQDLGHAFRGALGFVLFRVQDFRFGVEVLEKLLFLYSLFKIILDTRVGTVYLGEFQAMYLPAEGSFRWVASARKLYMKLLYLLASPDSGCMLMSRYLPGSSPPEEPSQVIVSGAAKRA